MRLVILHGYGAMPTSHWFTWLGDEIGGDVDIPALPDSDAPTRDAWVAAARQAMAGDDELVLVGHSLGSVAALLALDDVDRGRVLVAPFWERVPTLPDLDAFLDLPPVPDLGGLPVVVIASDDDPIVPPELSSRAAELLGVPVHTVAGGGHFLDRDGWTTLPAARDAVLGMLARA